MSDTDAQGDWALDDCPVCSGDGFCSCDEPEQSYEDAPTRGGYR